MVVFDIETPKGELIRDINEIYCVCIKEDDNEVVAYYKDTLREGVEVLLNADVLVGHNIIKFDIPVIERLFKVSFRNKVIYDTLILSKLIYPKDKLIAIDKSIGLSSKLIGSYSLKAFGYRFKDYKIEFEEFDELSDEMITYCKQDVNLTHRLYTHLKDCKNYPLDPVIKCENEVARIIGNQEESGFYFDIDKARILATELRYKQLKLELYLSKVFPPIFVADGDIVTVSKPRKQKVYIKTKPPSYSKLKPIVVPLKLHKGEWIIPKTIKFKDYYHRVITSEIVGDYQKIKLVRFNPNSRTQIVDRLLTKYNFKPKYFTDKGNIQLNEDVINELLEGEE